MTPPDSLSWNNEFYCHIRHQMGKMAALKLLDFSIDLTPHCHSNTPSGPARKSPIWADISHSYALDVCAHTEWQGRKREEKYWIYTARNGEVQGVVLCHTNIAL